MIYILHINGYAVFFERLNVLNAFRHSVKKMISYKYFNFYQNLKRIYIFFMHVYKLYLNLENFERNLNVYERFESLEKPHIFKAFLNSERKKRMF